MAEPAPSTSVDPGEIAKFSAMAAEWWDPTGKFAPLHKFNPVRLGFIRDTASAHFGRDPKSLKPFEGLTLLDIGCGGGLLSEPMARLGFAVTGRGCLRKEHQNRPDPRGGERLAGLTIAPPPPKRWRQRVRPSM